MRWGVEGALVAAEQADVGVQEAVQGLRARGQSPQAALDGFGDGVEEPPDRARLGKFRVVGAAPLGQHVGHLFGREGVLVHRADDEVVRLSGGEFRLLVGGESLVLMVPAFGQLAGALGDEHGQVTLDETGVLAGDFDLAGKGEVVAHENLAAQNQRGGKPFVVAVTQAEHVSVILRRRLRRVPTQVGGCDLQQTEVTAGVGAQAMRLVDDAHPCPFQRGFHLPDQPLVGDGEPSVGRTGRGHQGEPIALDFGSSTMQE